MPTSNTPQTRSLWAVTCYFNPIRYQRRLQNYHFFRARLTVPLVAVELSYDGQFDLKSSDAEIVVQLQGRDVMWQKERLLNVALQSLPPDCQYVAWLDCDLLFPMADWSLRAARELEQAPLVQLFSRVHYLGRDSAPGGGTAPRIVRSRPSLAAGVASGLPVADCLVHPSPKQRPGTYANGMAWAARRELLFEHRLFDANIIGGGDRAIACAAYGCFEHEIEWHCLSERQREYYLDWAVSFHDECRGRVAVIDDEVDHLWHGDVTDRGLGSRHVGMSEFQFDPYQDIAIDDNGCWRWSSNKPQMHNYVRRYFVSRKEDG